MGKMCIDCIYFNSSDANAPYHICEKFRGFVLENDYPCEQFASKRSPLVEALLFAGFLSGVSGYMDEIERRDDNGRSD